MEKKKASQIDTLITEVNKISKSKKIDSEEKFQKIKEMVLETDEKTRKLYNDKLQDSGIRAQGRKSILELDTDLKVQINKLQRIKIEHRKLSELVKSKEIIK